MHDYEPNSDLIQTHPWQLPPEDGSQPVNNQPENKTYRIEFINRVAGSAIVEATSEDEALKS